MHEPSGNAPTPGARTTARQRLAGYLSRRPWLPAVGPRLVGADVWLQRLTGGRLSFTGLGGMTGALLTTTGRRTGKPRTTPLLAIPDGDDLLLIASNWGKPSHPSWSANLIANPDATLRIGTETFPITARLLTGKQRAEAWATATRAWPAYQNYAARCGREIRIFRTARARR